MVARLSFYARIWGAPKDEPDPCVFPETRRCDYLAGVLGKPVAFAEDCIGPVAESAAAALQPGDVLVLENTRFHKAEKKNDLGHG